MDTKLIFMFVSFGVLFGIAIIYGIISYNITFNKHKFSKLSCITMILAGLMWLWLPWLVYIISLISFPNILPPIK
jgi:glucan phosphoethanolaminetransferase (alkaline phosphatase superfamily)